MRALYGTARRQPRSVPTAVGAVEPHPYGPKAVRSLRERRRRRRAAADAGVRPGRRVEVRLRQSSGAIFDSEMEDRATARSATAGGHRALAHFPDWIFLMTALARLRTYRLSSSSAARWSAGRAGLPMDLLSSVDAL